MVLNIGGGMTQPNLTDGQPGQQALQVSQALLGEILYIANDAIISVNAAQQIQIFNQGAEKTFGYAAHEVVGQPLDMLLPPRFRLMHKQHIAGFGHAHETARLMGERREIYGLHKDGHEFPAEASISKLALGDAQVFTVILRDITERKRIAEELEKQVLQRTAHLNTLLSVSQELFGARGLDALLQRALRHALALVPAAQNGAIYLAETDNDRLALRASHGFSQMPGITVPRDLGVLGRAFTSQQLIVTSSVAEWQALESASDAGLPLYQVLSLTSAPDGALVMPLMAYNQAVGAMLLLRMTGGELFAADAIITLSGLASLTAAAIIDERNRQHTVTLSSRLAHLEEQHRSMTAQLNYAEAGMLQAARLAAVGQLAASIAHEINNPLYAARNSLFLLEEDLPEDLRSSQYLRMATDQLGRIARIIERMRDFYRPSRGELGPVNVNQLLEETLALAGLNLRTGAIQMIFAPVHDVPPLLGNGDQLRQVFLNLVLNATDAMPDGGTLTVRTAAGPSVALVEIEDTGIGIPEDIRGHLFEPFWTNKSNGTGLGLSISAHIVTQHGGRIEVESVPGLGSTFRVVLPLR